MPLTQLVHYFNSQLERQARHSGVSSSIEAVDGRYQARFGDVILHTFLSPLQRLGSDELNGHYAGSLFYSSDDQQLEVDEVYEALAKPEEVIHLDRLARTLHSLNYLYRHDDLDTLLSLSVHSRHIASVTADHGKVFEKVLADCGLGPERVLLRIRLNRMIPLERFKQALDSYRSRGYRLAIDVETRADVLRIEQLGMALDAIFPGADWVEAGYASPWAEALLETRRLEIRR